MVSILPSQLLLSAVSCSISKITKERVTLHSRIQFSVVNDNAFHFYFDR